MHRPPEAVRAGSSGPGVRADYGDSGGGPDPIREEDPRLQVTHHDRLARARGGRRWCVTACPIAWHT
jgi:hypothetical protein